MFKNTDPSLAQSLREAALNGELDRAEDPVLRLSVDEMRSVVGGLEVEGGTKKASSTGRTSADGTCVCCNEE
jgi:hypothetical protein